MYGHVCLLWVCGLLLTTALIILRFDQECFTLWSDVRLLVGGLSRFKDILGDIGGRHPPTSLFVCIGVGCILLR